MKTWRRPYFERVLLLLDGDVRKAHLWYVLQNPHFGYVTPEMMIECGRDEQVLRMIEEAESAERRYVYVTDETDGLQLSRHI